MPGKYVIQDQVDATVTQCLTDDHAKCTGIYINKIFNHKLICKCKCHKLSSNSSNIYTKTTKEVIDI